MKKGKCIGALLSLLVTLSLMFQGLNTPAYADELVNVITSANITDTNGNEIAGTIGAWQPFRINADYKLPDNTVHEGDTTTIILPSGIVPASPSSFEIIAGGDVIANGRLIAGSPARVILTYTSYAEGKSGVEGKFSFNVQIDNAVYPSAQSIPVNLFINEELVPAGVISYKPGQMSLRDIIKSGWMWSQDSTVGIYQIKINQENKELINAKITDKLLNPGVGYIPGTLEVFQGKWELTPAGNDVVMKDKVDVSDQYANKITYNNDPGFTIDIGNMPAGTGLWFRYRVKIGYTPLAGEEFKNEATFINDGVEYRDSYVYKILGAGGSGEGYNFSLEINKTDNDGHPLKDAVFDIIRVRSGISAGRIITDVNGYARIDGLLRDDYKIHEASAPAGYETADDVDVSPADFDSTTKTATKTIVNKPVALYLSVSVEKKWIGKAAGSVTVHLYADGADTGKNVVLDDTNVWKDTFDNLDKYNANGAEINYTVKEDEIANYKSEVTGDMSSGFTITNTNTEKVSVSVTKKWVGKAAGSVTVHLYADGADTKAFTLTKDDNWTYTFVDFPKYDENDGHEIAYTVKEETISGYSSTTTGDAVNGYVITNTEVTPATPPVGPATPAAHNKPNAPSDTPNTSDRGGLALYGGMIIAVSGGIIFIIGRRKKLS